jgi:uncharacterized membrane protein YeaQ/YmgE (transglycosylase-associated protein family)
MSECIVAIIIGYVLGMVAFLIVVTWFRGWLFEVMLGSFILGIGCLFLALSGCASKEGRVVRPEGEMPKEEMRVVHPVGEGK